MTASMVVGCPADKFDLELLGLASSLVCVVDGAAILFVNRAGQRMLGAASAEALVGTSLVDRVVGDYQALLLDGGWDLLADEEFVPLKIARLDGSIFEAELRVHRVESASGLFLVEARDISKFVKSAEALREREARLHAILASVAEGIVTIDAKGVIESANPAAERMFGYPKGGLVGVELGALMPPDTRERHAGYFAAYMEGRRQTLMGRMVEGLGLRQDGTIFPMEISVSEVRHGRTRLFTSILRDISERKENEERIRRLAHHDPLTGLPNRNLLNDRMNHALARVRRHGGRMAVLYIDLDKFKPINDTLGHEAGDVVLCEVARRFNGCVRSSDTVARVGGDEFVIVIEEIARGSEAALVARKIIESLGHPIRATGHDCTVGASIGIAVFPDDGYTMDEVSKAADVAMYRVKHSGRNGYAFFTESAENLITECSDGE